MGNFEKGIELFNKGMFFEAHEEWEELWHSTDESPEKHFIQGMIMVAAAMHHYKKKEYKGTEKLLGKAIKILEENKNAKVPVDKEAFLRDTASFYEGFKSSTTAGIFPVIKNLSCKEEL